MTLGDNTFTEAQVNKTYFTNTKTMTDDHQSVTMTSEHSDSLDDTETDYAYDSSSDQEAITDILFPDLNSESDSDEDSLFGTK